MKFLLSLLLFFIYCSDIFAQNNNPQPPFSNLYRRPNVHPYTFMNPNNDAMDYQQMFYLKNKEYNLENERKTEQENARKKSEHYVPINNYYQGIRPTGHKTYFMNIP